MTSPTFSAAERVSSALIRVSGRQCSGYVKGTRDWRQGLYKYLYLNTYLSLSLLIGGGQNSRRIGGIGDFLCLFCSPSRFARRRLEGFLMEVLLRKELAAAARRYSRGNYNNKGIGWESAGWHMAACTDPPERRGRGWHGGREQTNGALLR